MRSPPPVGGRQLPGSPVAMATRTNPSSVAPHERIGSASGTAIRSGPSGYATVPLPAASPRPRRASISAGRLGDPGRHGVHVGDRGHNHRAHERPASTTATAATKARQCTASAAATSPRQAQQPPQPRTPRKHDNHPSRESPAKHDNHHSHESPAKHANHRNRQRRSKHDNHRGRQRRGKNDDRPGQDRLGKA
ncbi:hypothetical protein Ate01nite_55790 [Actinoplanes teichomyceticus]|nr:hypothetical protein Ate01nite_55790 [Actinoplanes teichomyceticus]